MKHLFLCASAFLLSSCALLDGKSRRLDVADGDGVSLDITRRAVLAARHPVVNADGQKTGETVRVCAEPSPDAMTTVAAELAASGTTPDGISAEIAANLRENGAFVGLRTQSIQLLRDAMYRSCEAYLSGGIDEDQYGLLQRRHQRYMLALLSIESLTGTVRAPTVTISTESLASAARSLSALREEIAEFDQNLATLTAQKNELVAKRDADGVSDEDKALFQS